MLREALTGDEGEDTTLPALEVGPRPAKAMQAEAAAKGISERSFRRARRAAGVVAGKERRPHRGWT